MSLISLIKGFFRKEKIHKLVGYLITIGFFFLIFGLPYALLSYLIDIFWLKNPENDKQVIDTNMLWKIIENTYAGVIFFFIGAIIVGSFIFASAIARFIRWSHGHVGKPLANHVIGKPEIEEKFDIDLHALRTDGAPVRSPHYVEPKDEDEQIVDEFRTDIKDM